MDEMRCPPTHTHTSLGRIRLPGALVLSGYPAGRPFFLPRGGQALACWHVPTAEGRAGKELSAGWGSPQTSASLAMTAPPASGEMGQDPQHSRPSPFAGLGGAWSEGGGRQGEQPLQIQAGCLGAQTGQP